MEKILSWLNANKEWIGGAIAVIGGIIWIIKYYLKKKQEDKGKVSSVSADAVAGESATAGTQSPITNGGNVTYNNIGIPIEMYDKIHAAKTLAEHDLEKTRGELAQTKGELVRRNLQQDQIAELMPLVERIELLTQIQPRPGSREDAHIHLLYKMMREITDRKRTEEN